MRRPGVGVARRRGFRGIGGGGSAPAAPFTPAAEPTNRIWWDTTTVSGAVASWVDKISGVAATQGTGSRQPTASATSIPGSYPGVTSDGNDELIAAGAGPVLAGAPGLTVTFVAVDATATLCIMMEYTVSAPGNDGGFAILPNGAAGELQAYTRGTAGVSVRSAVESLATKRVISIGFDFATAGAGAVSFIRVDGVAQALTTAASASAAGVAANSTLYLYARAGTLTAPWPGTYGHIVIRASVAQDAALALNETYVGAQAGIVI